MKSRFSILFALGLGLSVSAVAEEKKDEGHGHGAAPAAAAITPPPLVTPSPEGAKAYIIGLSEGDTVSNPVTVRFGLAGMGVAPAGMYLENTGHHHLLVDMDLSEVPSMEIPLPAVDNKLLHFGKGQTETTLTLAPGKHTLQLVLGNWSHIPHTPPVISEKITIMVKE